MQQASPKSEAQKLPQYLEIYAQLPIKTLEKIESTEKLISLLEILGGGLSIYIFYLIVFSGVDSLSPIVILNYPRWYSGNMNAYYLEWIIICLLILLIFLRKTAHNAAKIPLIQQNRLKAKQIYGDQKLIEAEYTTKEEIDAQNQREFTSTSELRDPNKYNVTALINIGIILIYLNYFPRKEALLPSFTFITQETAAIIKPAEYSTFFMLNIVFSFMIFTLFLFLLFYSLRQLKDIKKVIEYKLLEEIGKNPNEKTVYDWKPPLSKPWKYMTINERKEYDLKVIKIQKERISQIEKLKIALELKNEKEKLRLGEEAFKKKEKEKKEKNKTIPEKTKAIEREKYDFR